MLKIIIVAILFVIIDFVYLNSISNYFNSQIFSVQNSPLKLNLLSTLLCYLFLIFGIYYFIIKDKRSINDAFLLGLVIYMVFETTNKALLTNWKWLTVLSDGLWGGILFALTTFFSYKIFKLLKL